MARGRARSTACKRAFFARLAERLAATRARYGMAVLLDLHSMPPLAGGYGLLFVDAFRRTRITALVRYVQAEARGQILDGLGEREPVVVHEKAEHVPVRAAAEAVVELLGLAHRERRRFFRMKRAARDKIRARTFELNVAVDHIDDVDAMEQIFDERLGDHGKRVV